MAIKMRRGHSMFWGLAFITLGVVLLVNHVLGWNLPLFRILFSVFVIYVGFKMLFNSFGLHAGPLRTDFQAVFSKSDFSFPSKDDSGTKRSYQTVFGESILDLSSADLSQNNQEIKIDNVFGQTTLKIKKGTPFKVEADVVFGNIKSPDKRTSSFGDWSMQSEDFSTSKNHLLIKADVVFGQLNIEIIE